MPTLFSINSIRYTKITAQNIFSYTELRLSKLTMFCTEKGTRGWLVAKVTSAANFYDFLQKYHTRLGQLEYYGINQLNQTQRVAIKGAFCRMFSKFKSETELASNQQILNCMAGFFEDAWTDLPGKDRRFLLQALARKTGIETIGSSAFLATLESRSQTEDAVAATIRQFSSDHPSERVTPFCS